MKKIKIGQDEVDILIQQIRKNLIESKGVPEEIKYKVNPTVILKPEDRAVVVFEDEAYKKMRSLVNKSSEEIGWYGVVERESEKRFCIKDIIVFPQEVTGMTVQTDDAEYADWQNTLDDDTFNRMRFYGHSHVNMSVFPSGVDTTHYDNMLQNVRDFYIFGIFNKSNASWFNIYDVENNVLYENTDIDYKYYISDSDDWAKEQIDKFIHKKQQVYQQQNAYSYPYASPYNYSQKKKEEEKKKAEDKKKVEKDKKDFKKWWENGWDGEYYE